MLRKILLAHKEITAILLIFLLLGIFSAPLKLYLDDANYIFPAAVKNYSVHFGNYIRDNGFTRPLALLYYYIIFTVYLISSQLAHLIPLGIYLLAVLLIYRILIIQGLSTKLSFITASIIFVMPFSAESFSWFSASVGMLAFLIFITQVYIIETRHAYKKTFASIFFLSLIGSFLYETTLFMGPVLSFLWVKRKGYVHNKFLIYMKLSVLLLIPTILYVVLRIFSPTTIEQEFQAGKIIDAFFYWKNYLSPLNELFVTKGPIEFWRNHFLDGISVISSSPHAFILFFCIVLLYLFILFHEKTRVQIFNRKKGDTFSFWVFALLMSVLPLIWKEFYLPFRTFVLPSALGIILFAFLIHIILDKIQHAQFAEDVRFFFQLLAFGLLIFFLSIQVKMLSNYSLQYQMDEKILREINESTSLNNFNSDKRVNILITNIPSNTIGSFTYGDYIYSMFYQDWVARGFVDYNSGNINEIAIELAQNKTFQSKYQKEEFLTLRPLVIYRFTDKNKCLGRKCLEIVKIHN